VILRVTRFAALGRKLVVAVLVLACDRGFSPLAAFCLSARAAFPPWDPARGAPDGIIVLGASATPDISAARGRRCPHHAGPLIAPRRWRCAIRTPRGVFRGSANLISNRGQGSRLRRRHLREPRRCEIRLTLERLSRNTQEKRRFSKALVAPKKASGGSW